MINWDNLLQAIREDKVILLLGPNMLEIEVDGTTLPLHSYLVDTLRREHASDLLAYYEQDELFLFRRDSAKNDSYFTLKAQLHRHPLAADLLQKLSAVRLHLLLSFSPFLHPAQTFTRIDIPYPFRFGFYHMKRGSSDVGELTADRPLLYDFFGSIEEEESLILTHADLFDYIRSILGPRELDTNLKAQLQRARYFIFLGFQFDKWYVQLMLRLIRSINGNHAAYTWMPPDTDEDDSVMTVLTEEFDIRIIRDKEGVRSFINQLYAHCSKTDLLRAHPAEGAGIQEKVKDFIRNDLLEEAVDFLTDTFEDRDKDTLANDAVSLRARMTRLANREQKELITKEEARVARNQLRESLIHLSEQLVS